MEITAEIVQAFRGYYPEFADDEAWPDVIIERCLAEGDMETGRRWGRYDASVASIKKRGMFAFAAHRMVLSHAAGRAVGAGGTPSAPAKVASRGVGSESVSFAVSAPSAAEMARYGDLFQTIYGQEFARLRQRAGMGAVMV